LGEVINPIPQDICIVTKTIGISRRSINFLPITTPPITTSERYIRGGIRNKGETNIDSKRENKLARTVNGGAR
jgi:hypothetical protein